MIFNISSGNASTDKKTQELTFENVNINTEATGINNYYLNSSNGGISSAVLNCTIINIGELEFDPEKIKVEVQDENGYTWYEMYDKSISEDYIMRGYIKEGVLRVCMRDGIFYNKTEKTVKFVTNKSITNTTVKVTCSN